eukprot:TRINITY_DN13525_c0_g1_i1.p1 TRINITY_DN13525_c0_g1~~TRINITY_DN13525_c0_g1_i1.p1  ORF type:complete len:121 (-),score=14.30 TRINITY_DN13525_c0_g1_i1:358-720(-)
MTPKLLQNKLSVRSVHTFSVGALLYFNGLEHRSTKSCQGMDAKGTCWFGAYFDSVSDWRRELFPSLLRHELGERLSDALVKRHTLFAAVAPAAVLPEGVSESSSTKETSAVVESCGSKLH